MNGEPLYRHTNGAQVAKANIGKYTYGVQNIRAWFGDEASNNYSANGVGWLRIGAFCCIGDRVELWLGGNHRTDWITAYPLGWLHGNVFKAWGGEGRGPHGHTCSGGDVTIGNDVWISSDVVIMSGVTIGDGAVIANNSHVVKDVAPYTIVGGNPAKPIRKRFTDEQIEKLLKIQWWNLPDEKINEIAPLLCSTNIDKFISLFDV